MSISGLSANLNPPVQADSARQAGSARTGDASQDAATPGTGKATAAIQPASSTTLSKEALAQISDLQARDRVVRQHEQAHLAASGGLANSGPTFTYQRGPDGVNYAIGGEVHIDVSSGRTPEESIARARTIQSAALAPADPSGPDRAVAAQARQMEQEARSELALQQTGTTNQGREQGLREEVRKSYGIGVQDPPQGKIDLYA